MYKVMVTGHRPHKLLSKTHSLIKVNLLTQVQSLLELHPDLELVSGMALGVDTWFADIAVKLNIPFYAVIPFHGQSSRWEYSDDLHYTKLISEAKEIIIVSSFPSRQAYFKRNKFMVKMSNECIAIWDGSKSGTSHAVIAAQIKGINIKRINPHDLLNHTLTDFFK